MHLGGFLSTQEARVALGYRLVQVSPFFCACGNLPRASITRWLYAARLPFHINGLSQYGETCIKGTPSLKQTVAEVPRYISLIYFK